MFRIETFCEDKNLPRVLHALTGLVHGQPIVQPVANAKATKNGVQAKSNGELVQLFMEHIKSNKISTIFPKDMKEFVVRHGYSERSYPYFLKQMTKNKLLKRKPGGKTSKSSYAVLQ